MQSNEWWSLLFKGEPVDIGSLGNLGFFHYMTVVWISLLSAIFISFLYVTFYRKRATGSLVHYSFPLMSIAITGIFICIQFSLPLSLGLLGALSIVRFRTPIKEPEEIGFILLVIATSICSATFNLLFLSVLLVVAVLALMIMRWNKGFFKTGMNSGVITINLPDLDSQCNETKIIHKLKECIPNGRIDSLTHNDGEVHLSYVFPQLPDEEMIGLKKSLYDIEAKSKISVFFHHSELS